MPFFRQYTTGDDAPADAGDPYFTGIDMRRDPGQLEPGTAAEAVNVRFTNGVAEPRRGSRIVSWASQHVDGSDPSEIFPYTDVSGAGLFSDPISGESWLVIATTSGVYAAKPGVQAAQVTLPSGETVPASVRMIQTYNGLVMLRGPDQDPLYCTSLSAGWQTLPAATNDPANIPIPPASTGIYFQNRLFVVDGRTDAAHVDTVFVSDFGTVFDVLEGSVAYNSFKINQGSSDRLKALYRFNDQTLIAAKETSIYVVTNVGGTNAELAANAALDAITTEYGCNAPNSFVQVGSDVWFLAHRRGVVSIRQTEQNKLQGVDVPISRDIQPLIDRINWEYASGAVAASHDNRVYFAVPIDGSIVNNAVLVYDTVNQKWAGVDQGDGIKVREWVKFTIAGLVRLCFVSVDGFLVLYEDGYFDQTGDETGAITSASVQTLLVTRGYGGNAPGRKRFGQIKCRLSTWWPAGTIVARADGVSEEKSVGTISNFSRTRYRRPHGRDDWDDTNTNDDFHEPYREDYAVIIPDDGILPGDNGMTLELHQTIDRGFRLKTHGRSTQLVFTGTQGRIVVRDVVCETFGSSPRDGAQA